MKVQSEPLHSAKGAEKETSESGFLARLWKALSAFMSQGAASPVSWSPIWAPQ